MGNFLESVRAFIADNPLLQTGLDMGSIIVPFALLYAYFGLTFIAICGEIIALRRKRSAYNKCARQLACLSMLLGWLMLLGGRLWLILALDGFDSYSIIVLLSEATWMMFGFAAIVSCCYFMLWKFLANYPVLHIILGAIAFLQGLMTCAGVMAVTRLYNAPVPARGQQHHHPAAVHAPVRSGLPERPVLYPAPDLCPCRSLWRRMAAPAPQGR